MPAKRKVIRRQQRQQITAALLKLFEHWKSTGDEAPLAEALGCQPWQIPVAYPDEECPWPDGTVAYSQWPEAQAFYLLLTKPKGVYS
jgi:hypothetical protein